MCDSARARGRRGPGPKGMLRMTLRLLFVLLVGVPLLLSGALALRAGGGPPAPTVPAAESPAGSRLGAAPGRVLAQVSPPIISKSFDDATIEVGETTELRFIIVNANTT